MAVAFFFAFFAFFVFLLALRRLFQLQRRTNATSFPRPRISASSSSCSFSSPSRSLWRYDVFLSFRGGDTRKGFLSHLYKALIDEGIHTFKDDRELRRGNSVWPGLAEAIEESRFAVVILSENYASSAWCLEELLHITECAKKNLLELIPIFYGVDPSHVKRQLGSFANAFKKHEQRYDLETVLGWRNALAEVGKISGWDSRNWNEEAKLIEELVQDLSDRLFLPSSSDTGDFVGMSTHMRNLDPLLCLDSKEVRMVGIWGMGGIGKTTIAKFVHKCLSRKFFGACLLENVKGKLKKHGSSHLREKILSEIFRKRDLNTWDGDSGVMKRRLCGKKVLLVLDDVDNIDQLQELAGSLDWFGPGSRIIITTRDKRVLDQHDVEHIYDVKPLRNTQALQLFSKHAFKRMRPHEEFRELSIDVVMQLGGLPLALKVVGASLYRRDIPYWEDRLLILKNNLDVSISKVLRVTYDALDEQEKIIFLYVACCFNGEYMDRARQVLDLLLVSFGSRPLPSRPSIIALIEKCLISLSNKKRLWVHDLIGDMARSIICEGKYEKPWKRKILWDFEDINNIFCENMGAEAVEVESICLDVSEGNELYISPAIFRRMWNLKLLKFYNSSIIGRSKTCMPEGLDYLPPLRYLHWDAYTLKSLPSGFHSFYLVELNLPNSSVEALWKGTQDLGNLRRMNLTNCRSLIEIPDLSKAKNLESLKLSHCESLVNLPSSLKHLDKLVELKLINCKKLANLPDNIKLKSLRFLYLNGCSSLKDFPLISESLERLFLSQTAIEEVPTSVHRLSKLMELRLSGCKRLKNLPDIIKNLDSLRDLVLANCPNITSFPEVGNNIEWLNLKQTSIEEVPSTIGEKSGLRYLNMSGCHRLLNLPPTLQNLTRLKFLDLRGCTNVTKSPEATQMMLLDLHGTSVKQKQSSVGLDSLSLESAEKREMSLRVVPTIRRFFLRNVREHITRRKSRRS